MTLKYIGEGAYIAGVPACDLTQDMIDASEYTIDELLAFRNGDKPLYEEVGNGQ